MSIENIQDLLSDAFQSDLEHGVKCLNEEAAKEFVKRYPSLNETIGIIMEMEDSTKVFDLVWGESSGEGKVIPTEDYYEMCSYYEMCRIDQLDMLKDFIGDLTTTYDNLVKER